MKIRWLEIGAHIVFWLFSFWLLNQSFAFESIEIQIDNGVEREVYTRNYALFSFFALSLLAKMVLVYGNIFWALPDFLKNKAWPRFIVRVILLFSGTLLLEFTLLNVYDAYSSGEQKALHSFVTMGQLNALFYLLYYGLSVAYGLGKNWWHNEQLKEKLLQQKLMTELNFLKSQVNPHFLFNTLNNLFSIAEREEQRELSSGIAELANLMRYMLYDCQADRVTLDKEIALLNSVIEIHSLSIGEEDELALAFEVEGDYSGKKIAPLLLVSFVENAFKHGIRSDGDNWIKIKLKVQDQVLYFEVHNSLGKRQENDLEDSSGIGLENVRRRLELTYPEQYQLKTEEGETNFSVLLKIQLN